MRPIFNALLSYANQNVRVTMPGLHGPRSFEGILRVSNAHDRFFELSFVEGGRWKTLTLLRRKILTIEPLGVR